MTGRNLSVDGGGTLAEGGWYYSPEARRFVNHPTSLGRQTD